MSCRAQCQPVPEPRRHLPTFSPPNLPDGQAECLLCGDWITAVDFLDETCQGQAPPVTHPDQLRALPSGDAREVERARTLAMVVRCGEHQL